MRNRMPVLFIGHGSPMNVLLANDFTRSLSALGKTLPRPRAILVVSAHWLTSGTRVTHAKNPRTIHDFSGFPQALYDVRYSSPGAPEEAESVSKIVRKTSVVCDDDRGLDHASWAILKHLYPAADIPVFEMSLDYTFNDRNPRPVRFHYDLAGELAEVRSAGVLVIGSGNIVHNLSRMDYRDMDAEAFAWARESDERVRDLLVSGDHEGLIRFPGSGENAALAVPTPDHYLPMIYAVGMQREGEPLEFVFEGFQHGSISMRGFRIG